MLLDKLDSQHERDWYLRQAITGGWSRAVLADSISARLHERTGRAVNNFAVTLEPRASAEVQAAVKDPYLIDFAFVGRQQRLVVGGDEFHPDLLFYNFRLRCFVVVELKAVPFDAAFLGQLGLYMAAVDEILSHPDDRPTIGLLLCKSKNSVAAEWALRNFRSPIGVADWVTTLESALPGDLEKALPTIEQLESELAGDA